MVTLQDQQSLQASSSGGHECLCNISWKSIHHLLRLFSLDQSGALTVTAIPTAKPLAWLQEEPAQIMLNTLRRYFLAEHIAGPTNYN